MVNLIFGCIDNRRTFISRQSPPIWDAQLYIAVTFESIMQFGLSFQLVELCKNKSDHPIFAFRHKGVSKVLT